MKNFIYFIYIGIIFIPTISLSAQNLTEVTIDMGPVEILLGIVVVALLAMWGFRKFIKTANRI